jgi:flagellar hook protein FlgE
MAISFADSLSGLTSEAAAINAVSENLANLNTTGYKDEIVSFSDLVNQSLSGFNNASSISGSTYAHTTVNFTQGTPLPTGGEFDAAIEGGGFFVLNDPVTGQQSFTRQGNFQVDANGNLMTSAGEHVEGWNFPNGIQDTNGVTSDIKVPVSLSAASVPTTTFSIQANLNANAPVNSTFSSPIKIYDALGNSHILTVNWTETAAGTWSYAVDLPAADGTLGDAANPAPITGQLTFDGNGNLLTPAAGDAAASVVIPITLTDGANIGTGAAVGPPAVPGVVTWNLYDGNAATISQTATASENLSTTQDGSQSGTLTGINIGANGALIANFSNGTTETVAQIALASVLNPDSMTQLSNNTFVPTGGTATPAIGMPSTASRGSVTGGSLEGSTVDIATEFTNLLQFERGYQANSKAVTTEDQVIQATLALITG